MPLKLKPSHRPPRMNMASTETIAALTIERSGKFQCLQLVTAVGGDSFSGFNQYSSYQSGRTRNAPIGNSKSELKRFRFLMMQSPIAKVGNPNLLVVNDACIMHSDESR